jgi:hypothetical protein
MVDIGGVFDSNQHESLGAFEPIPAGDYPMAITASSIEDTKAKTGKYIKFEFTIMDGKFKGRKIWNNLNIVNPNPVAVEIAQKELATICRACNKLTITDTQELHEIPFMGKVKIRPASGDWPANNDMVNYQALNPVGDSILTPATKPVTNKGDDTVAPAKKGVPWA